MLRFELDALFMEKFHSFLIVLDLFLMPAAGNFTGVVVPDFFKVSDRARNFAWHVAAGIVFVVVGMKLMSHAVEEVQDFANHCLCE